MTPEQQKLSDELTNLQRGVVLGVVAGKSQREAYYAAGGKAKSDEAADATASEILSNPTVKAFHDSLISDAVSDAVLTRQKALERLSLMAATEITDILDFRTVEVQTIGKDGEMETAQETIWAMRDSPDVERKAKAAIKSVTMTKFGPKIEMYDATSAIAQIAKMQSWDAPAKLDVNATVGVSVLTPADYKAARAEMLGKDDV
jgi:phage terminase small subunit